MKKDINFSILILTIVFAASFINNSYWLPRKDTISFSLIRAPHTLIGIAFLAIFILFTLKTPNRIFRTLLLIRPLFLLLILSVLLFPLSPSKVEGLRYIYRIVYILLFSTFFLLNTKLTYFRKMLKWIMNLGLILCIAPFIIYLAKGSFLFQPSPEGVMRFSGLGAAEAYGILLGFYVVIYYVLLVSSYPINRTKIIVLLLFSVSLEILTFTRSAILTTILTILVLEFFVIKSKSTPIKLFSIIAGTVTLFLFSESIRKRLYMISMYNEYTWSDKLYFILGNRIIPIIYVFTHVPLSNILLGLGPGGVNFLWNSVNPLFNKTATVQIESEYFITLFNLGILGLLLYIWFIIYLLRTSVKVAKNNNITDKVMGRLGIASVLYHFIIHPGGGLLFHNYIFSVIFLYFPFWCILRKSSNTKRELSEGKEYS